MVMQFIKARAIYNTRLDRTGLPLKSKVQHYIQYCMVKYNNNDLIQLLNQACAWFLEIAFVRDVSMSVCVCVSAPKAINYIHMCTTS